MPHSLTHPERLTITGPQGETYQGGDQEWYRDLWQRRAGCGPTTAAALLSYLSQTRPGLRPMVPAAARTQAGFLRYMEALLAYVTPVPGGWTSRRAWCWAAAPSPCPRDASPGAGAGDPPPSGRPGPPWTSAGNSSPSAWTRTVPWPSSTSPTEPSKTWTAGTGFPSPP